MGNMSLPEELRSSSAFERFQSMQQRAGSRTRLILGIAGVLIAAGLVWWLGGFGSSKPKTVSKAPVIIAKATEQPVTMFERTIGTVVANSTVQVTSRVEGQLVSAAFKEGDFVKKGDLLFQLDPRPFQAALEQAVATQNKDAAQAAAAEHDAQRYAALVAQGAVSRSQADQYLANSKAMAATVAADKANVDAARLNLVYAQIRSPIDGKTGAITIQPGNIVPANGSNPLVTITQIQPIKVSFNLPQSDVPQIQAQMNKGLLTATIKVHDDAGPELHAPVTFIGNAVSDQTGTIEMRATYPNSDSALVPGQLVDVNIALKSLPNATVVPHDAVTMGPDGPFVYLVTKDDKADMRPVKLLYDDGAHAAVAGRVKPGDRVVIEGQLRLVPGADVSISKKPANG
ncbi:MAG TPA: efflux RND transporter periplasmic adaptor subunit [Rhizomicrobium sp.]|nr:efflux RND transporter periplasmic adaptor subunit [Rhizomicrobium sp.]